MQELSTQDIRALRGIFAMKDYVPEKLLSAKIRE
jgi:hypothetical protein